jgi:hypothetical protein
VGGTPLPAVNALAVHDDGSGAALHAGGDFSFAGGLSARRIASWDGTQWSALANGIQSNVNALASHDDGGGTALFTGGLFLGAGDVTKANHIARWDGAGWSALGDGLDGKVQAMAVYDDGSGPALYAAGTFTIAGGVNANLARWDGTGWSALASGISVLRRSPCAGGVRRRRRPGAAEENSRVRAAWRRTGSKALGRHELVALASGMNGLASRP